LWLGNRVVPKCMSICLRINNVARHPTQLNVIPVPQNICVLLLPLPWEAVIFKDQMTGTYVGLCLRSTILVRQSGIRYVLSGVGDVGILRTAASKKSATDHT